MSMRRPGGGVGEDAGNPEDAPHSGTFPADGFFRFQRRLRPKRDTPGARAEILQLSRRRGKNYTEGISRLRRREERNEKKAPRH